MSRRLVRQGQEKAVPVESACRALGFSRSGYYAARRRAARPARVDVAAVQAHAAFESHGRCYGSRRMVAALRERGLTLGRHRVRRLMREKGLRPVWRRQSVHTTDSGHGEPVFENVLARQFGQDAPNRAWVSDITYIRTDSGWLYLAAVLDLFSRKIVGWAAAPGMPARLACDALQMALGQRRPPPGLIVHSDRGSQYASHEYRSLLQRHALAGSMSRKGNCWDNAVMERFWLNLKQERVWQRRYANHAEAKRDITDYIVGFYNSRRLHSTLGNLPPNAYERNQAAKQPISVSIKT